MSRGSKRAKMEDRLRRAGLVSSESRRIDEILAADREAQNYKRHVQKVTGPRRPSLAQKNEPDVQEGDT